MNQRALDISNALLLKEQQWLQKWLQNNLVYKIVLGQPRSRYFNIKFLLKEQWLTYYVKYNFKEMLLA